MPGIRSRTRLLAALLVAATVVAVPCAAREARAKRARSVSAERLEASRRHVLRTLTGESLSIDALRGQVVVLNFWASWCAPCRKELPRLDALHAELARRGGRVLAISIDEDRGNVLSFVKAHSLSLPVCHDGPQGLARTLDLPSVPFTLVLDRTGAVAYTSAGSDPAALEALAAATRRVIGGEPYLTRATEGATP